jgi:hypothetical protein
MLIYALSFLLGIGLFALKNTLQISLVEWGVIFAIFLTIFSNGRRHDYGFTATEEKIAMAEKTTRVLQLVTNCDQLKMIKNLITDLLPLVLAKV